MNENPYTSISVRENNDRAPNQLTVTFRKDDLPPCFSDQALGQSIRAFGVEWVIISRSGTFATTVEAVDIQTGRTVSVGYREPLVTYTLALSSQSV